MKRLKHDIIQEKIFIQEKLSNAMKMKIMDQYMMFYMMTVIKKRI